jgi:quercetin dioxygenase-like cupin family protein
MSTSQYVAVNANDLPWEERFSQEVGRAIFRKELFSDPETGMLVRLVRYPSGVINPRHTHPCGHGMYVLSGTLVTHKGRYPAGSFVWFPEGEVMEHGASADADVTVVFVTNKPFRIDYEKRESAVGSTTTDR